MARKQRSNRGWHGGGLHYRKRGMCPKDNKVRYPTDIDAKMAISRIVLKNAELRDKIPQRAYFCPACKDWHITSKPFRPKPEPDEVKDDA